jgi:exosome complex RNA-binding protein Rrp42 (RNase PH superfamily)
MIVWRFTLNLAVVVADGNLFDACLIASNAAISNGDLKPVCPYLS